MEPLKSKKIVYGAIMIGLTCVVLFFLPIWMIEPIEVTGTRIYTEEDIIAASGIKPQSHILSLRTQKAKVAVMQLPYIEEVEITYTFPNHIQIQVVESGPVGYVKFLDSYLCIGEKGHVLEQVMQPYLNIPVIEGLKFRKFTIGDVLPLENEDHFLTVVEIMSSLKKYEYDKKIDSIDVSNLEQIHLYVDKLDVIIGNIRDFDKKVKWLAEIHQEYPMGVLDLSYINDGRAILTPLT
ncbi:MAG: cell division protein FtsQ/DivIB [Cellulosilyticaceae bacterium]